MPLPVSLALFQGQEILIVLVVVVLLFGATKIPQLARSLGKAKSEFQKGSREGDAAAPGAETALPAAEAERVLRAARELGIPTEGRPLADVKADVQRKMGA